MASVSGSNIEGPIDYVRINEKLYARVYDIVSELNKQAFRSYLEAPIGDPQAIQDYIHPDVILPADVKGGLDGLRKIYRLYAEQFDQRSRVIEMIAEDDKVVARVITSGRQIGEYMGLTASGKSYDVEEFLIARFVEGKMIEVWRVADRMSLFTQLGGTLEMLVKRQTE